MTTEAQCASCGETEAAAIAEDLGWRYQTSYDGEANWLCVECHEPAVDGDGLLIGRGVGR